MCNETIVLIICLCIMIAINLVFVSVCFYWKCCQTKEINRSSEDQAEDEEMITADFEVIQPVY